MREVVFDTETTGLDPTNGHRVVEIACVELENLVPTGNELHLHFNPDRTMPAEALAIHGLTDAFLADKPRFADHADRVLEFFAEARLIAHNAAFDIGFLRAEFARCGRGFDAAEVADTLQIARRKFPGAPASLDALCRRFGIDLAERVKHGALIDTRLLARVYLELMGGKEPGLALAVDGKTAGPGDTAPRMFRPARIFVPSEAELAAHRALLDGLKDPLWSMA
jgi:DNA polymerase-3 subunit epsilon